MWQFVMVMIVLMMTVHASTQNLYKCKAPDGRTIISNTPCASNSSETVIPSAGTAPRDDVPSTSVPTPALKPPGAMSPPSVSRHASSDG